MTVRLILRQAQDDKAYATSPFGIVMAGLPNHQGDNALEDYF
jgi:hypothetical protein